MSTQIHITNEQTNEARTFRTEAQAQEYIETHSRDGYVAKKTYHAKVFGVTRTNYIIEFSRPANALRNSRRVIDVLRVNEKHIIENLLNESQLKKLKKADLIAHMESNDIRGAQPKSRKADLLRIIGQHAYNLYATNMSLSTNGDPEHDEALIANLKGSVE
jgi:hypothetical protein